MGLTKKMRTAAQAHANDPFKTDKQIAQEVGASTVSMCRWRKSAEWNEYVDSLMKNRWKEAGKKAQQKMEQLMEDGDFKAVQYILDSAGYKATEQLEINTTIKVSIEDD